MTQSETQTDANRDAGDASSDANASPCVACVKISLPGNGWVEVPWVLLVDRLDVTVDALQEAVVTPFPLDAVDYASCCPQLRSSVVWY